MDKKAKKHVDKKCHFCGESDYSVLDLHRITPGSEGGKYTRDNTVTSCSNCHRKSHSGYIKIDRWYNSSKGRVLHYFVEGEERFD